VRVAEGAVVGKAKVKFSFEGWPEGEVGSSEFEVPVVLRKEKVQSGTLAPRNGVEWASPVDAWIEDLRLSADGREAAVLTSRGMGFRYRLGRWQLGDASPHPNPPPQGGRKPEARQVLDVSPGKLLGLTDDEPIILPPVTPFIRHVTSSPDGRWLLVLVRRPPEKDPKKLQAVNDGTDSSVHLIDASTGQVVRQLEFEPGGMFPEWFFSPDSRTVAGCRSTPDSPQARGEIALWAVSTGRRRTTLYLDAGEMPRGIVFSPDGGILAVWYWIGTPGSGTLRHMVKVLDAVKGNVLAVLPDRHWNIKFAGAGRWLVTQSSLAKQTEIHKGEIRVYDLTTQPSADRVLFTYQPLAAVYGTDTRVHLFALESHTLLLCFGNGRIVALDLPSGNVVAEQPATTRSDERRSYWCWTLSPNGRFLAGGVYSSTPLNSSRQPKNMPEDWEELPHPEIHVWDTARLNRLQTLTDQVGMIRRLAFSGDSRWLLSGGSPGLNVPPIMRLWDFRDIAKKKLSEK
jgi:WD40 repeat protein